MICPKCGLKPEIDAAFCPACGTKLVEEQSEGQAHGEKMANDDQNNAQYADVSTPIAPSQPVKSQDETLATASLVCGIIGIVLGGGAFSILAVILGFVANSKNGRKSSATTGIILGSLGVIFNLILIILIFVFPTLFVFIVSGLSSSPYPSYYV